MIRVDETDPVGEIEPSFPYRAVTVRKGVQFNDSYDIQSEIGRGKFGTVYRCKEKKNGLALAAKVVNTSRKEDKRAVEREVEIMRRLQHPRLIQLYDAIDNGKQIYVILELIQGGELFERVIDDDFLLTERSCAVFMRQICEGIEFIHGQHILHLDMKPENILCLTKEGNRIKIIDFGLAREYDPKKKLQVLFGTPEFVAPEVVNFDQIGFGTDMWSIGVICYVLLSGLSPFMGDTDIETMANVTIAKYDFDDEAFTGISEDAKDFIRCLLVKDISKRANASQCRQHRWLVKMTKPPPSLKNGPKQEIKPKTNGVTSGKHELDVTKDNLRLFVERWREHPNSPYTIELQTLIEVTSGLNNNNNNNNNERNNLESMSLCCHTPTSSCESLSSSISDSTNSTRDHGSGSFLAIPNFGLALERRASEGARARDAAAQILLAEEIIKLSEHLRLIAMGSSEPKKSGEKLKTVEERQKRGKGESDKRVEATLKAEVAPKRAETAENKAKLAEKKAELVEKKAELAEKKAEPSLEEAEPALKAGSASKKAEFSRKKSGSASKETESALEEVEPYQKAGTASKTAELSRRKARLAPKEAESAPQKTESVFEEAESALKAGSVSKKAEFSRKKAGPAPKEAESAPHKAEPASEEVEPDQKAGTASKKAELPRMKAGAALKEAEPAPKAEIAAKKAELAPKKAESAAQEAELVRQKAELDPKSKITPKKAEPAPKKAETASKKAELALKKAEPAPEAKLAAMTGDLSQKKAETVPKRPEPALQKAGAVPKGELAPKVGEEAQNKAETPPKSAEQKAEPNPKIELAPRKAESAQKKAELAEKKAESQSIEENLKDPKIIPEKRFPIQNDEETNEISEKLSNIARQRKLNGTAFNGNRFEKFADNNSGNFTLRKTNKFNTVVFNDKFSPKITDTFTIKTNMEIDGNEMDLTPPWRKSRPKRRFSESCRDVPRITSLQDLHKTLNLNEPKSTKDLLLQLLTEWDEARPSAVGRKSSVDWCGDESIARRSINSLAEYFQSEQKKSANSEPATSIQR